MRHQDLTTLQPQGEYFAAVDMGSNSFHLVVVHVVNGNVQIVSKVKQKVQLAAGLNAENFLHLDAMERGWQCLATFADRLKDIQVQNIRVVATATLRLATNADDFLLKAEAILSQQIKVISGVEEAEEIYRGVAYTSTTTGNTLVIDIGGASTEVIIGRDIQPIHLHSFNMGCVTFTERYFAQGQLTMARFDAAIKAAKAEINPHLSPFTCFDWEICLGASGTPQAITEILQHQGYKDAIRLDYLYQLREQCCEYAHIEQLDIAGLAESRQAIFPSGLAILIALFEQFNIDAMNLAGGALREGLIYGMLDDQPLDDRRTQTIIRCIKQFHIHAQHAQQVTHTALGLYQQYCAQAPLCSVDSRTLLHTAAMLHETGLHISFKNQQQHAQYILSHYELPGYTKLQKECLALLVGNYKESIDAEAFAAFPEELRTSMVVLIRILRIACLLHVKRNHQPALIQDAQISLRVTGDKNNEQWELFINKHWLDANKLVQAELANEAWLQHRVKWTLSLQTHPLNQADLSL